MLLPVFSMICRDYIVVLTLIWCAVNCHEDFSEELIIKPLPTRHVYNFFKFTTILDLESEESHLEYAHYDLFPKLFGEVLDKFEVRELHLTLTQGLWRYKDWGYPVEDSPPGAELWVWFQPSVANVDQAWTELVNVLSGLFCASLNFMDSTKTFTTSASFQPRGSAPNWYAQRFNKQMRYAALPNENVCTENLTPWKKLLPCTSKTGLATLFNAIKLYDSAFNALSIHVRPICADADCSHTSIELSQSLTVVFNSLLFQEKANGWSFKKMFGTNLYSMCPIATDSRVLVDITSNKTLEYYFTLSIAPKEIISQTYSTHTSRYAVYNTTDIINSRLSTLSATYNKPYQPTSIEPPVLYAHRSQAGHGQQTGGVHTLIYNNHPTEAISIVYMDTFPWFLRMYHHTLKIETYPSQDSGENTTNITPEYTRFIPGRDRQRGYLMELIITLPPRSTTRISISFERALLKWTEYPPDANHGFYMNAAVISAILPEASKHYLATTLDSSTIMDIVNKSVPSPFIRIHTETILVSLPTPDFSMPYNVICLACTVVAIAFGSLHNLTTRRFTLLDPKKKGLIGKVKAAVGNIFKFKSKKE